MVPNLAAILLLAKIILQSARSLSESNELRDLVHQFRNEDTEEFDILTSEEVEILMFLDDLRSNKIESNRPISNYHDYHHLHHDYRRNIIGPPRPCRDCYGPDSTAREVSNKNVVGAPHQCAPGAKPGSGSCRIIRNKYY